MPRSMARRPLLLLILLTGLLTACATRRPHSALPAGVFLRPTGLILKVDPHQHFVLFESAYNFPPGTIVTSVNNGQSTARLRVTPQRTPPFYTADILEGLPAVNELIE